MTLDEFLDDYVPKVLRPMGGWYVRPPLGAPGRMLIRRPPTSDRPLSVNCDACPLTAAFNLSAYNYERTYRELGLSDHDATRIRRAADDYPDEPTVRGRLLIGLGFKEPR